MLQFYNERRKQLWEASPNDGHLGLAALEEHFATTIITQNIDDLHERAGSKKVIHLHGELKKARSTADPSLVYTLAHWELKLGDVCEKGSQLRPHIVWFGEAVPAIEEAIPVVQDADILVVIGTSLVVYPAAGLVGYVKPQTPIFVIDPNKPSMAQKNVVFIQEKASVGIKLLYQELQKMTWL